MRQTDAHQRTAWTLHTHILRKIRGKAREGETGRGGREDERGREKKRREQRATEEDDSRGERREGERMAGRKRNRERQRAERGEREGERRERIEEREREQAPVLKAQLRIPSRREKLAITLRFAM